MEKHAEVPLETVGGGSAQAKPVQIVMKDPVEMLPGISANGLVLREWRFAGLQHFIPSSSVRSNLTANHDLPKCAAQRNRASL